MKIFTRLFLVSFCLVIGLFANAQDLAGYLISKKGEKIEFHKKINNPLDLGFSYVKGQYV